MTSTVGTDPVLTLRRAGCEGTDQMKKSTQRKMNFVVLAILAFNIFGTIGIIVYRLTSYQDLLRNGRLTLQTSKVPGIKLTDVQTCAHGHEFLVSGFLQSDRENNAGGQGTIDVSILSPGGATLERVTDRYRLSPSHDPAGMHFLKRFRTVPPTGSVLRIEWDRPQRPGDQSVSRISP